MCVGGGAAGGAPRAPPPPGLVPPATPRAALMPSPPLPRPETDLAELTDALVAKIDRVGYTQVPTVAAPLAAPAAADCARPHWRRPLLSCNPPHTPSRGRGRGAAGAL